MKKIIYGLIILVISSCTSDIEAIDNYPDCVVHEKIKMEKRYYITLGGKSTNGGFEIQSIRTTKFDWDRYQIGDTIK